MGNAQADASQKVLWIGIENASEHVDGQLGKLGFQHHLAQHVVGADVAGIVFQEVPQVRVRFKIARFVQHLVDFVFVSG